MATKDTKLGLNHVLSSGSVITHDNEPVEVEFTDGSNGGESLFLIFSFEKDTDNEKTRINGGPDGNNKMVLKFINVPPGSGGPVCPMELGENGGKKVFLNLISTSYENLRLIEYTIYREP